ncbi:MAG: LysM peptidoglycan-binding domain-containing protein [Ruminiclostridium sp.]
MDGNVKLSATVISCKGEKLEEDDFYFDGNFSNCHHTDSIQCSFEKSSNNYIFAISDSIGLDNGESNGISAIKEIKKYHESAKIQQFSLETITEKIYEAVQLSSNLIYSKSIISNQNSSILTGFSSVIIDNNRAVVMNLGNNGVFLYRQGEQKEVFARNDSKKNQKLKMLGISPTAPDIYNDTDKILKLAEEESKTKIKISSIVELEEGDILILCSDGLLNSVSKSRIESVIDSGFDPSKVASILFQEALKNGIGDGITIMTIRVDEIKNISYASYSNRRLNQVAFDNEQEDMKREPRKERNIVNYVLAFVCVIVISGVLFMGYLILRNIDTNTGNSPPSDISQSSFNTSEVAEGTISTSEAGTMTDSTDSSSISQPDDINQEETEPSKQNTQTDSNEINSSEYDIHIVQSGDTLSSISSKYYGDPNKYNDIIKYNNLKDANSLYVDQELKIPKLN